VNKNNVKCIQGISFSQITFAENFEIKNSGCATPDLIMSYLSSSRRQTYVRKVNPAMYTVNGSG
jgi:hypothetical protein